MTLTTTRTVGEIAAEMPGTTREFEKLGIDYCCGGSRTLGEACAAANISIDEALARLEKSAESNRFDAKQDWQKQLLADLISHITGTHHAFVRTESPRIEALAAKVAGVHGKNHPELLQVKDVFSALAAELSVHLMKKEQILFPYVQRMEESALAGETAPPAMFGTVLNPVRMMMQEHDGAGDLLRTLGVGAPHEVAELRNCHALFWENFVDALQEVVDRPRRGHAGFVRSTRRGGLPGHQQWLRS